jgi:hypothetical protein
MRPIAPAAGIAMCRIRLFIGALRMFLVGYNRLFKYIFRDDHLGTKSE